jgi:tripartite-type tricarboxylate transporter receptor subunit TctC
MAMLGRFLVLGLIASAGTHAVAQSFPSKPVRIVVGFVAGGATDTVARVVAQQLSERFGKSTVVENRAGASGTIGAELVAKSPPDGHVLFLATQTTHAVAPYMLAQIPYDPVKDFAPVALVAQNTLLIVVTPTMPVKSVQDLIALAKARPGELNFATGGVGTSPHMSGELFKTAAKIDMVPVHYKGDAAAVIDVIGGQVPVMFLNITGMLPHVKGGKLRGLAVTSATRSTIIPEYPTIAESGLPGYEVVTWFGVLAPAATPVEIIARLNREILQAVAVPSVKEQIYQLGLEIVASSPDEYATVLKSENARWSKMVRDLGLRAQ